jgi:hypothetical protein
MDSRSPQQIVVSCYKYQGLLPADTAAAANAGVMGGGKSDGGSNSGGSSSGVTAVGTVLS